MIRKFPQARKAALFLSEADPRLKAVIDQVGPVRLEIDRGESVFESLATSVVYQQLHGKAAATILGRFKALYSTDSARFPEPRKVIATELPILLSCGLSRSKAAAIQDLARRAAEREIPEREATEGMSDAELIEVLTQVKGIGVWTVQMFLIFTLGRPDVFPTHDYGVRKGYAAVFRKRELPTPKAFEKIGARWSPHRSTAAWYFWRALELPEFQKKKAVAEA